jgi:hypothetical protein
MQLATPVAVVGSVIHAPRDAKRAPFIGDAPKG